MQFPANADQIIVTTDEEMLRKTVSKIVDNSVKFTQQGGVALGFKLINNEIEIFKKVKSKQTGLPALPAVKKC